MRRQHPLGRRAAVALASPVQHIEARQPRLHFASTWLFLMVLGFVLVFVFAVALAFVLWRVLAEEFDGLDALSDADLQIERRSR